MPSFKVQDHSNLSKETASSRSECPADGKHSGHLKATREDEVATPFEKPGDVIQDLFISLTTPMAIKVASDMEIFDVLTHSVAPVTWSELAAPKNADRKLVERMMRVLVSNGFADQAGPGKYTATNLSRQMTDRRYIGLMGSLLTDFLPAIQKTPTFLQQTRYQNPSDPANGPMQYAYHTPLSCWEFFAENPPMLSRFNTFMEGHRGDQKHWADWFPVQRIILDGAVVSTDAPLIVDVAGGRGHDLVGFKERFPQAPGCLVLEDLPAVIDDIHQLNDDIKRVKHDMFKPQPIKDARVYYFKHIMHDWSDKNCQTILAQTKAAMKKGYSKILIEDFIVADENPSPRHTALDMLVMVVCPGLERTRQMWTELLHSVGLKITQFHYPADIDGIGIIEAEL